jgi:hypothetical protein
LWAAAHSGITATGNVGLMVTGPGNGITIDGVSVNTPGTVSLSAPGTVQEINGGAIQADELALMGWGTFILTNSTPGTGNAVNTLAAVQVTSVDFEQYGALRVGSVTDLWAAAHSGITATGNVGLMVTGPGNGITIDGVSVNTTGTVSLSAPGTVQEINGGAIQADELALMGGGTFILANSTPGTGNAVTTLAAAPVTSVDFEQYGALTVGSVTDFWGTAHSGITATGNVGLVVTGPGNGITIDSVSTTGTVSLSASGTVQEINGGAIQADELALMGGGTFILANSTPVTGNAVNTLAAAPVTSVDFEQYGALTVGSVTDLWAAAHSGITATGTVTLLSNGGNIQIGTAGVANGISAGSDVSITAHPGATGSITVGTGGDGNGIVETGSTKTVALTAGSGGISINGTGIDATGGGGNTVKLTSTGTGANMVQQNATGNILADNLALLGGGDFTLANHGWAGATNVVNTLSANAGVVDFEQAGAFTVGTAGGTNGITTTGDLTLLSNGGNIQIGTAGVANGISAGSDVSITATSGSITVGTSGNVNNGISATSGAVTLMSQDGTITLQQPVASYTLLGQAGSGYDYSILVVANSFKNLYGDGALDVTNPQPGQSSGRFVVYTNDTPTTYPDETLQGLRNMTPNNSNNYDIRYDLSYNFSNNSQHPDALDSEFNDSTSTASGASQVHSNMNYFFYSYQPTITLQAVNATRNQNSPEPPFYFKLSKAEAGLLPGDYLFGQSGAPGASGSSTISKALNGNWSWVPPNPTTVAGKNAINSQPWKMYTNVSSTSPPGTYPNSIIFNQKSFQSPLHYQLFVPGTFKFATLRVLPLYPTSQMSVNIKNVLLQLAFMPLAQNDLLFSIDGNLEIWGPEE